MNLRYHLRAYEDIVPVRVAAIVVHLTPDGRGVLARDEVVAEWGRRYPDHVGLAGKRGVRGRVGKGLSTLKVVDAIGVDGRWVTLGPDLRALRMAAGNLRVLETVDRRDVPRTAWTRAPQVPAYLEEVQRRFAPTVYGMPDTVVVARR